VGVVGVGGLVVGNGNKHHGVGSVEEEMMEAKLGGLGAAMLRGVDAKMEVGGRERQQQQQQQMSEGDVGTTNSPQVGKSAGGGGGGRGRSSRDPAIEWSENATTVLLQAFGEKYRALDRGNFTSKIWADIAARVNGARGGLTVRSRTIMMLSVGFIHFLIRLCGLVWFGLVWFGLYCFPLSPLSSLLPLLLLLLLFHFLSLSLSLSLSLPSHEAVQQKLGLWALPMGFHCVRGKG